MGRERIDSLWREHQASRLPDECRDTKIHGIHLGELDGEMSSCIAFVLDANGFDHERRIVLSVCHDKLARVGPQLTPPAAAHFARLQQLGRMLIEEFS